MLNINEILSILPHRYPFILVDKIIAFKKFKYLNAIKNISINEPFFQGHFPKNPIYPGTLLLESMIQTTGLLIYKSNKNQKKFMYYVAGIDQVRFKKFIFPGDQIIIESFLKKKKNSFIFFNSIAKINNKIICKAKFICTYIQK
ncbi:3-hydroxyacyl-ACP dehydratase FabZ [Enterobacteriaceae endosymbiont of Donacia crassipes]|uniref:3-hydroxyacyl-ACP dehydratase FabZ n=1 Tax=Enterobacteriaceae endosymbiont of Donacia crassipes TaxID=2675776 RepID=UPI00144A03EE|nr:3-hydroxyacyl-ACP dehydratase FabZ [Enterobacteriaceae endosymbiont of Donacia crassipes]QJC34517.1 3-hydroxyacyl-ACP dehydratase FabZ [Enterobacteriaceae endosymbiont of Donacia crassipes]